MRLPLPSSQYSQSREAQRNEIIERADRRNLKRNEDVEVGRGNRLILSSPDGVRWKVTVDNSGNLSTSPL